MKYKQTEDQPDGLPLPAYGLKATERPTQT